MPVAQQAYYEIHPHKRAFERNIERYKSDDLISEANRKLVLKFADQCFAENLSVARINKYLTAARTILHKYSFDLSNPDVEALKALVSRIQLDAYAYATKVDFKIFLKKF